MYKNRKKIYRTYWDKERTLKLGFNMSWISHCFVFLKNSCLFYYKTSNLYISMKKIAILSCYTQNCGYFNPSRWEMEAILMFLCECSDDGDWCHGCRRGISNFYNGKSKSFTSLAEASSSSSIKDVGKPENAYTRKRRNLLAFNHVWDKNQNLRSHMGGGITKRPLSSSRSTLAFAVSTMSSSDGISSSSEDSSSRSPPPQLPPPHPRSRTARRNPSVWPSFSSADLQQCGSLATTYELLTEPGLPK